MKASRHSVAAIGFALLVIAIDFAVIRAAFLSPGSKGWGDLPECAIADSCHGMGLRGHLRGCHPDRVLLHPASACHTHRGLLARNFWPSRPTMEVRTRIAQLAASRQADGVDDVDPFVGNRFGSAGDACARQISERESEHSSFDRSAYLGRCTLASPVVPSRRPVFRRISCRGNSG
jgi:hypothetical protein